MKEIIGTLVFVDTAALVRDFDLNTIPKSKKNSKIPVFNLNDSKSEHHYILMITRDKYAESGLGTRNLTLKVKPGDEIRWWEANVNTTTNVDVRISKITPVATDNMQWNAWVDYWPKSSFSETDNKHKAPPYLSGKEQFWAANYAERKYHTKIKDRDFSYNGSVKLSYQIDMHVLSKPDQNNKKKHLCTLRWYSSIHIENQFQTQSDNPEALENQIPAGFVDGDLFIAN
jgi:hypothetical protein